MRLIDADAFVRVLERKCGHLPVVVDTLKLLIGMQPTVDPLGDILDYGDDGRVLSAFLDMRELTGRMIDAHGKEG